MATPIRRLSAGASFTPSPVIATDFALSFERVDDAQLLFRRLPGRTRRCLSDPRDASDGLVQRVQLRSGEYMPRPGQIQPGAR